MKITQGAPKVEISTTNRKITAHAGAVLVRATAEAIGLGPAIDAHLRLKVRDRGLSEAESILGMAEALAAGAKCLDDLEVARADRVQEELRGFGVPPPQTAGRFLRRFCLGHIGQLNKALRQVLHRGLSLVGVGEAVTLDFDSTYIRSRSSRRQGADPTYLKRYALHPLVCFVAGSGICLHAKLRRGRVHTAKGLLPFVDECLRRIPGGVGCVVVGDEDPVVVGAGLEVELLAVVLGDALDDVAAEHLGIGLPVAELGDLPLVLVDACRPGPVVDFPYDA